MCRKFHGAAFATFGEARVENFRWLKGEELLQEYRADNGTLRRFCRNCGSSMTFTPASGTGELIEFALGTLDSPMAHRPDAHIFVGFKAGWYDIRDSLPRYQTDRCSQQL